MKRIFEFHGTCNLYWNKWSDAFIPEPFWVDWKCCLGGWHFYKEDILIGTVQNVTITQERR